MKNSWSIEKNQGLQAISTKLKNKEKKKNKSIIKEAFEEGRTHIYNMKMVDKHKMRV